MYKRQLRNNPNAPKLVVEVHETAVMEVARMKELAARLKDCLLYTSDAADERSSVDLGGRRIIKKKQK